MERSAIRIGNDPKPGTPSQLEAKPARDLVLEAIRARRFGVLDREAGVHWRAPRTPQAIACLHCGATPCHRWGTFSGRQRYRCARCRRTFSDLTGSAYARCKRIDRMPAILAAMERGESVRQTASSCGIAPSTAFRWRHRYLTARGALSRPPFAAICTLGDEGMGVIRGDSSETGAWFAFARGRLRPGGIVEDRLAAFQLGSEGPRRELYARAILTVAGRGCLIEDVRGPLGRFGIAAHRIGLRPCRKRTPTAHRLRRMVRAVVPFLRPFRGVSPRWARNYLVWGLHLPVGRLEWPVRFGRLVPPVQARSRWAEHLVVVVPARSPPVRPHRGPRPSGPTVPTPSANVPDG